MLKDSAARYDFAPRVAFAGDPSFLAVERFQLCVDCLAPLGEKRAFLFAK